MNDIQRLMAILQKAEGANFEYLNREGRYLFLRDGSNVVRFIFDDKDNLASVKVVALPTKEKPTGDDTNQ